MQSTKMASRQGAMILTLAALPGCASYGFGYDREALREQVSFETRCPPGRIVVRDVLEAGRGHTKFRVEVCGKEERWNRYGASYFPEGKGPLGN